MGEGGLMDEETLLSSLFGCIMLECFLDVGPYRKRKERGGELATSWGMRT